MKIIYSLILSTILSFFLTASATVVNANLQLYEGVKTTEGAYTVYTFKTSGSFVALTPLKNVEYLIVAGGSGASGDLGGRPGSLKTGTIDTVYGRMDIKVGKGGTASNISKGNDGEDSSFGSIVASGGVAPEAIIVKKKTADVATGSSGESGIVVVRYLTN